MTALARTDKENFLTHRELTETNKALLFFSELGSNLKIFSAFSFKPLMLKLTKLHTKRFKLSFAMFDNTVKILFNNIIVKIFFSYAFIWT